MTRTSSSTAVADPGKRSGYSLRRRETIAFYLCISPWIVGFLLFVLGPMVASLAISTMRWDMLKTPRYVGLDNYPRLFTNDPLFWQSMRVTAKYTLLYVPD